MIKGIEVTNRPADYWIDEKGNQRPKFHACIAGDPARWETGKSVEEAVGRLIRTHANHFEIKIIEPATRSRNFCEGNTPKAKPYPITTQPKLRKAFWEAHPNLSRMRVKDFAGRGTMYTTDTRVAWITFVDAMSKDGQISPDLAARATLKAD